MPTEDRNDRKLGFAAAAVVVAVASCCGLGCRATRAKQHMRARHERDLRASHAGRCAEGIGAADLMDHLGKNGFRVSLEGDALRILNPDDFAYVVDVDAKNAAGSLKLQHEAGN